MLRVLILTDELFAVREQSMLTRLEVGLADEGIRVAHAVPESAAAFASGGLISRSLAYPHRRFRFGLGSTARAIIRGLAALSTSEDWEDVDLIHVFGGAAWPLGVELAKELEAPLVLEVWRLGLVARAFDIASRLTPPPIFVAPDPAMERSLRKEPAHLAVRSAPWGVLSPASAAPRLPEGKAVSVMLVGTGRDKASFQAALEGLALSIKAGHDLMIFCDALAARRAGLWPHARSLGILDRLTLIPDMEGRRDLILEGDLLIQPDASGEQRSITLEAMAHAMIVLAMSDPDVSVLQDGRTARIVPRIDARLWAEAVGEVLADVPAARRLGMEARRFIAENRRASDQVKAVLETYTLATRGEVLPFKAAAS
jgi:hypothetical protein